MVRGVREGVITVAALKTLLKLKKNDKTKLPELLLKAYKEEKITEEVFKNSLPTIESTIKCYLYSIISDQDIRAHIEQYVLMASELYSRGSFIANLIAINRLGNILDLQDDILVPKYDFRPTIQITELFGLIETETFKHCFLPERWSPCFSGPKLAERLEDITAVLRGPNRDILRQMRPNWSDLMSVSGWDNSINRMYSKYRANIQNHVMVHLEINLKKYFNRVELNLDTQRNLMYNTLIKPLRPIVMHNDDFELIVNFKQLFKMDMDDYFPKYLEYTPEIFEFYMFMVKNGITNGTYLPISTLGRKYCYLDAKILRFLLPDIYKAKKLLNPEREPLLTEMLDITPDSFKERRRQLRKKLRKNKKVKKKWRNLGYSKLPKDAKIYSLETDGVGLSICIHKSINLLEKVKKCQDQEILDNPVFIGMDLGRAKAYAAAISLNPIVKPESLTFTRRKYYFEMKHRIRKRFEATRSQQPHIQEALQALSLNNGKKNLPQYLTTLAVHYNTLKQEYLIDKERALWRMRLYRLKMRSLDKAVQRVFDRAEKRPLVLGVGSARFPATGPGEKSMPTTQFVRTILKAKYRYNNTVKLLSINEFRTTVCCCGCGQVTTPAPLPNLTRSSRRLRLCTVCSSVK
jgi:hypothetical protein